MKVQLVRNATLLLDSSHGRILVDPMLRAAGTSPPIENTPNQKPNPLVELPMPAEEVLDGVELCIVTHLHRDHFDDSFRSTCRSSRSPKAPTSCEAAATRTSRRTIPTSR